MSRAMHYLALTVRNETAPACGAEYKAANITPDVRFVTCKKCKKWLATCDDLPAADQDPNKLYVIRSNDLRRVRKLAEDKGIYPDLRALNIIVQPLRLFPLT